MCRFVLYLGEEITLSSLVTDPTNSIIRQSYDNQERVEPLNGDGFGVAWYAPHISDRPALFRAISPAWNNQNLLQLAPVVQSSCVLAHVRAASPGLPVIQLNCHPFTFGRLAFMHNGDIPGFPRLRRRILNGLSERAFGAIQGSTDSEVMFHLALTFGLEDDPIPALQRMAGEIERVAQGHDIEHPIQMTLGLTDGTRIYAVRYSSEGHSRSLFCSEHMDALKTLYPELEPFSSDARAVVSEPIGDLVDTWLEIPEASITVVEGGHLEAMPFEPRAA